jgi:adenosylcobinamide-GDP ribazoletransferase
VGRATLTFPVVGALLGAWCLKKIGGITGDTMGANTEVCEVRVFVVRLGVGEGGA